MSNAGANADKGPDRGRVLTTREAWLALARAWDKSEACGCGCGRRTARGMSNIAGLCAAISTLRHRGDITEQQEGQMLAALPARGPTVRAGVRPYLWPTTPEGAGQRAEFCREQAKLARGR